MPAGSNQLRPEADISERDIAGQSVRAESNSGPRRIRVMHLITGLHVGGAETMLASLLAGMDRERFQNVVYCMTELGPVADTVRKLGIEVHSLGMKRGTPDPRALIGLARGIRRWQPMVIQTWMYHADLLGGIAGKLFGGIPVVWGIHASVLRPGADTRATIRLIKVCARLSSRLPARIVCCAEASRLIHARMGYPLSKMVVIPNGFDLQKYFPEPDSARRCEDLFNIPATAHVVTYVARYHPQKDHRTFFAAAKLLTEHYPDVLFVLCGDGIDDNNRELMALIDQAGVRRNTVLLGRRKPEEIALIFSRSQVATLSASWGEAFPLVIGEAMACGAACVVTDVGDSAYMVGDCGIVVRPESPRELAEGWRKVISMEPDERKALGLAARRRIEESFTLRTIVSRYQDLYSEVAGKVA